eukprot:TRINITY_DN3026_c0_g1_i2.p1 TRINITY_DN3026_c0_g1~~TRINITY_DN3026_c0_g1_i2.p1  ORF type:complete len:281 (-),score=79.73 TRINITY_DN3026_c0_g1_i2:60-902(-)
MGPPTPTSPAQIYEEEKKDDRFSQTRRSDEVLTGGEPAGEETPAEKLIRMMKRNSNIILHERNKYVFLASVAEDADSHLEKYGEFVSFFLTKKLLQLVARMKSAMETKQNFLNLLQWDEYIRHPEFQEIFLYIARENDLFRTLFETSFGIVKKSKLLTVKGEIPAEIRSALTANLKENVDGPLRVSAVMYVKELVGNLKKNARIIKQDQAKALWVHADQMLDCLRFEAIFRFETTERVQFNFQQFYDEPSTMEIGNLALRVQAKLDKAVSPSLDLSLIHI